MTFALPLPDQSLARNWKVKIRLHERNEEPHVSVIFKGSSVFRFGLRTRAFLDRDPDPRLVPQEIIDFILAHLDELIENWGLMYPENPVSSTEQEEDDD
ncbi:MAG: hypothetical protein HYZ29_04780 [Myxococcales bacterium]|nr:hypothetical protein [Myxococcales bacterium]